MTFNSSVAPSIICNEHCDETSRELVSLCWDALREANVAIPTHLQFREKQILVKNHTQEITVVNRGYNEYYFLYMAYGVDGAESAKFASADFTLEPV